MIKHITIETNRGEAFKRLKARLDKVGLKCCFFSWYVDAKKCPSRLLKPLQEYVTIIDVDGRTTLNSIRKRFKEGDKREISSR